MRCAGRFQSDLQFCLADDKADGKKRAALHVKKEYDIMKAWVGLFRHNIMT